MCSALAGIVGAENKQLRNHYETRADELEARDTTARSESFSGRLIRCANYLSRRFLRVTSVNVVYWIAPSSVG
jgi:hypothetical protein